MMKIFQRLGKSLMLPVACLPVCAILMGIGYWIDSAGMEQKSIIALFLINAGGAIIKNMGILFAIGVSVGMAADHDGTAALSGLVSLLLVQTLLSTHTMALMLRIDETLVNPAFAKIDNGNQFIGIMCGLIGAVCYNKFKNVRLPSALAFFNGKRCVAIITAGITLAVVSLLVFLWPLIYGGLVTFGKAIVGSGAVGAGIYGFLNRLLIPFGLHHALNSVFWFDIADISDIGKFWGTLAGGVKGQTGMYMTGFFPVMMFGLPGAALAMYHTAKTNSRKNIAALLLSASFSAFFTGITEPLEFSFMFLAPLLYLLHAMLTGISLAVCAMLPVRSGFNFSGGFVDWLLSLKAPMAQNPWMLIPIGIIFFVLYYFLFRLFIIKFDLQTPGREDDEAYENELRFALGTKDFSSLAKKILAGLGGRENIASVDNCITRLRVEVHDFEVVSEKKIKSTGIAGVIRPSKTSVQVIIGTNVQFVTEELKKLL